MDLVHQPVKQWRKWGNPPNHRLNVFALTTRPRMVGLFYHNEKVKVTHLIYLAGPTPDDQQNKESIPAPNPNKEALRSQTNNGRSGLKIKAPTLTDRNTPTQQLPSPLASSSEDEGEDQFKKTTTRAIRPPPSKMGNSISINDSPLNKNEQPFIAKPLRKKRDPRIVFQRALARREAHGDLEMKYTPLVPRFPTHLQQNRSFKSIMTPLPRSRLDRGCHPFSQELWISIRTPETIRKTDIMLYPMTERAKRPAVNNGRIQKKVRESVGQ